MTSQGTAHGRFQRAIERGQLFHAELAARELGHLNLANALALSTLIAQDDAARYGRAAVRWHGRFALEAKGLTLPDSQLALAATAALPTDVEGAQAVLGAPEVRQAVDRFTSRVRAAAGDPPRVGEQMLDEGVEADGADERSAQR